MFACPGRVALVRVPPASAFRVGGLTRCAGSGRRRIREPPVLPPFTLFIALTLCVKHIKGCVTFVKFCELGDVAGDVAGWV